MLSAETSSIVWRGPEKGFSRITSIRAAIDKTGTAGRIDSICQFFTNVPISSPALGESICACIIPRSGCSITLKEVRELMKDKVAPHKLPDELCILDDFPKLSGGVKIKKFSRGGLGEMAQKNIDRDRIR